MSDEPTPPSPTDAPGTTPTLPEAVGTAGGAHGRKRGIAAALERANAEVSNRSDREIIHKSLDIDSYEQFIEKKRRWYKYQDWMPKAVYEVYARARGAVTKKGLARRLGIGEHTLYDWINKQSEFAAAIRAGEALQEERFASYMIDAKYVQGIFGVLKNLHHWADKIDETHALADLREEFKKASQSAKRVVWDKPTADAPKAIVASPHDVSSRAIPPPEASRNQDDVPAPSLQDNAGMVDAQ